MPLAVRSSVRPVALANAVLFFVVTVVISLIQLRLIQRRGVSL